MKRRYRTFLYIALVGCGLLLAMLGGLRLLRYAKYPHPYGPWKGQFVDAETGAPLKDVAVLVVWWKEEGLFQSHLRFYDAREAVSDAAGHFAVPRIWVPLWAPGVQPGQLLYFAPGYAYDSLVMTPPDGVPYEAPTVVMMRRIKSREDLLKRSRGYPSQIPEEKMKGFLKALNVEYAMLGLVPIRPDQTPRSQP
jgi:hypothetical protein